MPNPNAKCGTCDYGDPVPDSLTCTKQILVIVSRYPGDLDAMDTYRCPVYDTAMNLKHKYNDHLLPLDERCRTCPALKKVAYGTVACKWLPRIAIKDQNDWCGQWKPKGAE